MSLKAKLFLVFLPNGKAVEIPAESARMPKTEDGTIPWIEELRADGSIRRYCGLPVMLETHPPSRIEAVTKLPPGLLKS